MRGRKLSLQVDALQVETFAAETAPAGRGTVEGYALPTRPGVCPPSGDWYCTFGGLQCTAPVTCAKLCTWQGGCDPEPLTTPELCGA